MFVVQRLAPGEGIDLITLVDAFEVFSDRQWEIIVRDAFHALDGRYTSTDCGNRTGSGKAEFQESAPAGIRLVVSGIIFIFTSKLLPAGDQIHSSLLVPSVLKSSLVVLNPLIGYKLKSNHNLFHNYQLHICHQPYHHMVHSLKL